MSIFKAARGVGKGVRYLTQLGSKIGKGLGSSVDKLGAGTRNAQASVIKGARGARDAANSAGRAVAKGASDARRGYHTGRTGGLHLDDVAPRKSSGVNKLPSLNEWMNTHGKQYIKNPGTMPGNKLSGKASQMKGVSPKNYDSWAKKNPGIKAAADKMRGNKDIYGKSTSSPGYNGKNWAVPVNKMPGGGAVWDKPYIPKEHMNRMTKFKPKSKWIKTDNSMTKSKPNKVYVGGYEKTPDGKIVTPKKSMNFKMPEFAPPKFSNAPSGMSKNRRAGIITGASIAGGYGLHKANDALQNHYRQQKNAARGGM
jgi:hypothetical protein